MASGEWRVDYLTSNVNHKPKYTLEDNFDDMPNFSHVYTDIYKSMMIPKTVWDENYKSNTTANTDGTYTINIWGKSPLDNFTEPKICYTIGRYYAKRKTINYKSNMQLFYTLDECVKFLYDEIGDTIEYCVYEVRELKGVGNICTRMEF